MQSAKQHPRELKANLARIIVSDFHTPREAREAEEEFQRVFKRREAPEFAPEAIVTMGLYKNLMISGTTRIKVAQLVASVANISRTEAERLIRQGAVETDGSKIEHPGAEIDLGIPRTFVLRVGKHTLRRVTIRSDM